MDQIVIDSDVFIDYSRIQTGLLPRLLDLQKQQKAELFVSSVTVFELFSGKLSLVQETSLQDILKIVKIVPLDETIAKFAGEINRDNKINAGIADILIAATALFLKARLATKNKKHFKNIPNLKFF